MRISDWSSDVCTSDLALTECLIEFDQLTLSENEEAISQNKQISLQVFGAMGRYHTKAVRIGENTAKVHHPDEKLSRPISCVPQSAASGSNAREIGRASCRARVGQYV